MTTAGVRNIIVLGDGAWGTALALVLCENGHRVSLWGPFPDYIAEMRRTRRNDRFLSGIELPDELDLADDMAPLLGGADLVVFASPVVHLRKVADRARACWGEGVPVITVSKGIENESLLTARGVIRDVLGNHDVGLLYGPSHAEEVARRLPTTIVAAAENPDFASDIQRIFMTPRLRVYTSTDTAGVELCAALKNVIAIAAGIGDGLGFGDNAKAALATRGLAEITRLGLALGARSATFAGLAGVGDLITTCISPYGRNLAVGRAIGKGEQLDDILERMGKVVPEGVWTARSARELARREGVEMPITEQVCLVLFENKSPLEAVSDLMTREARPERDAERQ